MNIKNIVEPASIALYGVSKTNRFHPANIILRKNRKHSRVKIYAINPSGGTAEGEKLYTSINELPALPESAVFVIKAEHVPKAMIDCAEAGVRGGIVISGGFGEAGRPDLQKEIKRISIEKNFPIIGPNGLGVYSPPELNTFFFPDERFVFPPEGNIGLASQSGGILVDLMIRFAQENVGISRALSIGNKAVIDEVDALKYFRDDPRTDVIGIYFEGFADGRGRDFIEELRKTDKPVVIYKAGKTEASAKAISSHTAAVAGEYAVFRDILASTNAVEVHTEPEFLSACEGLAAYGKCKADRAAVITMSGGHGVIASDYCHAEGITIEEFTTVESAALRAMMSANIQEIASFTNPIDLTGSAVDDDYFTAAEYAASHPRIDAIIMLFLPFIPAISSALPARLSALRDAYGKPIVCYAPYLPKFGVFIEGFEANGIPVAHSIDSTVKMLSAIRRRQ
jgi:acyl-CoA synthetase (NDP forming)